MRRYAPWEKAFEKVATPFEHFVHTQTATGAVLMVATLVALILANSPLHSYYEHFFHINIDFNVGEWKLSHSIHHWINDGLMAIFFFMVGLEIKREVLFGGLSSMKDALLPIIAAIGGMVVPALIYYSINAGGEGANGWGIPMATDIAFAITALVLLGKRVPPSLYTFLVALAIVDDLGAVLVIALFYTQSINLVALGLAGVAFLVMLAFNFFGIRTILPYFIVGLVLWFFMLESGVHATIAGVIAALAIPSKAKYSPLDLSFYVREKLDEYDNLPISTDDIMHEKQKGLLSNIKDKIISVQSPAQRLEHLLHLPVSFIIIPIFALANAGISIDFSQIGEAVTESVTLGVAAGLLAGKVLGIFGSVFVAVKLGLAKLPEQSNLMQLLGIAFLGGIGFTMSIFVADLAFISQEALIFQAKIAILFASLVAGVVGYMLLKYSAHEKG